MGLRDRLRARSLPTGQAAIAVDPVAYRAAEHELEVETRTLQLAQVRDVEDLAIYQDRVDAAQAVLDALPVEVIRLRCLPVAEWEALVGEHPPTGEQRAQGWQWNTTTFRPALLAASVVAADGEPALTEMDWAQVALEGQVAVGELDLIFGTAVQLNARQPQVSTGKG